MTGHVHAGSAAAASGVLELPVVEESVGVEASPGDAESIASSFPPHADNPRRANVESANERRWFILRSS